MIAITRTNVEQDCAIVREIAITVGLPSQVDHEVREIKLR